MLRPVACVALLPLLLAGCAPAAPAPPPAASAASTQPPPDVAPLTALHQPALLLTSPDTLPESTLERIRRRAPAAVSFRAGTVSLAGRDVTVAGVDPSRFRAFTPRPTAASDALWEAVARGEAVASHELAARLGLQLAGPLELHSSAATTSLRLGGFATTGVPAADLLVTDAEAARLGLLPRTGLLLAPAAPDPALAPDLQRLLPAASVRSLAATPPTPAASLAGSALARSLGGFSYRSSPDGTVSPDPRWVSQNITTGEIPLFTTATCHRLVLPRLRGALEEVAAAGLAGSLSTFDGCYVPRHIGRSPDRPLSLHTWGAAVDFDAQTNLPGSTGTMDLRVVAIFKRWGFAWGGDWVHPDPMHFELAALASPR